MKKYVSLIVLLFLLFFSCEQGDVGMFYSLEVESEVQDSSLANNLTIGSMVKWNNSYYIASGAVLTRATDGVDWIEIAPPAAGQLCTELALFDGTVYGCWYSVDGTASALYTLAADNTWILVPEMSGYLSAGIVSLADAPVPVLFIITRDDTYLYTLWYKFSGQAPVAAAIQSSIPMNGAAWANSQYYVIAGNTLYQGPTADALTVSLNTPALAAGSSYNAIASASKSDGSEILFVSTTSGTLFANDGTSWGAASVSVDVPLYGFSQMSIEDSAGEIKTNLLVGSSMCYYEILLVDNLDINAMVLSKPGIQTFSTTGINYVNTTLSKGAIRKFFYDDRGTVSAGELGDDLIFACTAGAGLWINQGNLGYRSWSIE
ncbi:MAG: hypothetical protein E4H36_12925 [Spirochaetales bacterium]|nr:MAG: hypothetical protein E4H36_12925 [Spirochaetales bacterium]